jgi:oxygen-independent coproporphyrinogen III oxidase
MGLSVYVHIPYCIQRCRYCDFTTFEWSEILPPEKYTGQVRREIQNRQGLWRERQIQTLYFGGGTPSLIAPQLILSICDELANAGFTFANNCERTIEINPATLDKEKLDIYARAGINRYSVGAQSFNDKLLKTCGRRHSAADTRATLRALAERGLNYSFDLLFALPGQTMDDVNRDLDEVLEFSPNHLSAYCLTVPETHPMSQGRPPEGEQVEMFALIERRLKEIGLLKYEISNFAKPGYESRHNTAYWNDSNYWGIGLSSHSYSRDLGPFGMRFWNPKSLAEYEKQVEVKSPEWTTTLPAEQFEALKAHEAMTDFSHMHLRTARGLPRAALHNKFAAPLVALILPRLENLVQEGLLEATDEAWTLTQRGQLISNKVFEKLTFLAEELKPGTLTQATANSYFTV